MSINPEISVNFYQLRTQALLKAAPKLIEKIYFQYKKLVIFCPEQALVKNLDDVLWTYTTKHFLPHGTVHDPLPELQPIYITYLQQNPSNSDCLLILGASELEISCFQKIYYIFDGNDSKQLDYARDKWKFHKRREDNLIFWQQNNLGIWENR